MLGYVTLKIMRLQNHNGHIYKYNTYIDTRLNSPYTLHHGEKNIGNAKILLSAPGGRK